MPGLSLHSSAKPTANKLLRPASMFTGAQCVLRLSVRLNKVAFQLRVAPEGMRVVKEDGKLNLGAYWLVKEDKYLRAYGLCIYPMD